MTHGAVQYPRDTGGSLPYILHYGIDFDIGDSYNWNPTLTLTLTLTLALTLTLILTLILTLTLPLTPQPGDNYNWNKMVYKKLDISKCQGRFFGAPPKPRNRREEAGALVVNTLNRAFCGYYATHCAAAATCPPTEQPPGGGLVKVSL